MARLSNLSKTEKRAYMEVFAAEGGDSIDPVNGASSGITNRTLDEGINEKWVKGIQKGRKAKDLSYDERAGFYRDYFDFAMNRIGGSLAFAGMNDAEAASAIADTLIRHGRNGGGALIRKAINRVASTNLTERNSKGHGLPFNETVLPEFQKLIANPGTRRMFLDALADERIKSKPGEALRFNHFRFRNSP